MVWNYAINVVSHFNQNVMKVDDHAYECDSGTVGFELIVGLNTLKQLESE